MTSPMNTDADHPSFDLQSIHVSFEERRWLYKQRQLYKLDDLVQKIADLHKTIRGFQQFTSIPTTLTSSSMIAKGSLDSEYSLYYPSVMNGFTNSHIDQFRLHHQQTFQLIFADLSNDLNYRIFMIIMEGFIFYSSQSVKEYLAAFTHEMRKCLGSFQSYIQTRTTKILNLTSFLPKLSLSFYGMIHTNHQNNIGILYHFLPKIQYYTNLTTECNTIVAVDEYSQHIISPEELRFIDYAMNMKTKRHLGYLQQPTVTNFQAPAFTFSSSRAVPNPIPNQSLHSLPIVYPYSDDDSYKEEYPKFWTGNNHKNEDSSNLYQNISIETNTPEYLFVQRLFNKSVPENDIKIAFIERIQNPHLWKKFRAHRSYMRQKNGKDNLDENWLFHGTKSDNHQHIMSHGFNRSYCRDYVLYGQGVYFSRYASYSCNYSDRQDLSSIFLCRVLAGYYTVGSKDIKYPPKINLSDGKQVQADSTTDQLNPFSMICTFHDDQSYPEYVITYMKNSNV